MNKLLQIINEEITKFEIERMPIKNTELSLRTKNILSNNGIEIVADITAYPEKMLRKINGMGVISLMEIKEFLEKYGLSLVPPMKDDTPVRTRKGTDFVPSLLNKLDREGRTVAYLAKTEKQTDN